MWNIFEQLMNEYGVTMYRVAKECGFHPSTLTRWKDGKSSPKKDKLLKIAAYFNVPVEYLMTGSVQTNVPAGEYDYDIRKVIVLLESRPDLKELIDEAKSAAPEDVKTVTDVLRSLKRRGK